jgi:hypothetical protein
MGPQGNPHGCRTRNLFTNRRSEVTVAHPEHPSGHPDYSSPTFLPPGHVQRLHASDHDGATSSSADDREAEEPQATSEMQSLDRD